MIARWFGIPLAEVELRRQSRRIRTHLERWALLAIPAFLYLAIQGGYEASRLEGRSVNMREVGASLFPVLAWTQLVTLILLSIIASGALVTEEKNRKTLDVLLSTPLTAWQLVFAKFLTVQLRILLLVLAMFPFYVLLLADGGLAPAQVVGVAALSVMLPAWIGAAALCGAALGSSRRGGSGFVVAVVVFYALLGMLLDLLAKIILPYLWPTGDWSWLSLTPETQEAVFGFQTFRLFAFVWHEPLSAGQTATILGIQSAESLLLALVFIGVTAALLRLMAQAGDMTVTTALWRSVFPEKKEGEAPPRRRWERTSCRPWSWPTVWRALAPRATPNRRRLGYILVFLLTLAVLFAPLVFYTGEFVVQYGRLAYSEIAQGRGLPALPDHPLMEGGALAINAQTGETFRLYGSPLHRSAGASTDILEGWLIAVGTLVLVVMPLVLSALIAAGTAREAESDRLDILRSSPLSNGQLALGFVAEGLRRGIGVFLALPLAALVGIAFELLPFFQVLGMFLFAGVCGLFYGALGLRLGLTAKSVRKAQSWAVGIYALLCTVFPLALGMLAGILNAILQNRGDGAFGLLALSPALLPFFLAESLDKLGNRAYMPDHAFPMLYGSLASLLLHAALGILLSVYTVNNLRKLLEKRR